VQDGALAADPVSGLLPQAQASFEEGDYTFAASVLQALGLRGQAYDRMDEVLYWLGKTRAAQGDWPRAERCFTLLKHYYPRSPLRFSDFELVLAQARQHVEDLAATAPAPEGEPVVAQEVHDGPLVNNVFMQTDLRQALADISAQTGVRILTDPLVQGLVTADFTDTPLSTALDELALPLGFSARRFPNHYLIGKPSEDGPSFLALTETVRYQPEFLDAKLLLELLPAALRQVIRVDEKANAIAVTATPEVHARFAQDLKILDQPRPQVLLEALVVEMDRETSRALGIEWSAIESRGYSTLEVVRIPPMTSFDPSFQLDLIHDALNTDIRTTLRALDAQGLVRVRANPSVATLSGEEATIRIGREEFFSLLQGSAAFPYITLEKIPTGITLRITPSVGSSHRITAEIHAEVSDVTGTGVSNLPITSVRTVDTRLRVGSGETIVVGGMVLESERREHQEVPGLGQIPLLGALFSEDSRRTQQTEVTVFITPYILIDPETFLTL